jgi:hypothetical protein
MIALMPEMIESFLREAEGEGQNGSGYAREVPMQSNIQWFRDSGVS